MKGEKASLLANKFKAGAVKRREKKHFHRIFVNKKKKNASRIKNEEDGKPFTAGVKSEIFPIYTAHGFRQYVQSVQDTFCFQMTFCSDL